MPSSIVIPEKEDAEDQFKLYIATVDTPAYRQRLEKTLSHLREKGATKIEAVDLLDASRVQMKTSKVLMAGWRDILLPRLSEEIVIILEDDARLVCSVTRLCAAVRSAFEHLNVPLLSLGHAWKGMATQEEPQYHLPLRETALASVHATTAIALRGSLEFSGPLTHLDEFLFRASELPIAFRDPPLVGWATESVTLTNPLAHGCGQLGGGRKGSLPIYSPTASWLLLRSDPPPHLPTDASFLPPGTRHLSESDQRPQKTNHAFPGLNSDCVSALKDLFHDD